MPDDADVVSATALIVNRLSGRKTSSTALPAYLRGAIIVPLISR